MQTQPRERPDNVKEALVVQREFDNIKLLSEQVAEFKKKHEEEVKSLCGPEWIKTTTPVLVALAKKPE